MSDRSKENVPRGDHVPGGPNDASAAELNQKESRGEADTDSAPQRIPARTVRKCRTAGRPTALPSGRSEPTRNGLGTQKHPEAVPHPSSTQIRRFSD